MSSLASRVLSGLKYFYRVKRCTSLSNACIVLTACLFQALGRSLFPLLETPLSSDTLSRSTVGRADPYFCFAMVENLENCYFP